MGDSTEAETVSFHLTGFGQFSGVADNPTSHIVKAFSLVKSCTVLETSRSGSEGELAKLAPLSNGHSVYVHLGVNSQIEHFNIERTAWNEADYRCKDERGWATHNTPLDQSKPVTHQLRTAFDVPALVEALKARGWGGKVSLSDDAGRFVCNSLYYASLAACRDSAQANHNNSSSGGKCSRSAIFIHVPPFRAIPESEQRRFVLDCLALLREQACAWPSPNPPGEANGSAAAAAAESASTNGTSAAAPAAAANAAAAANGEEPKAAESCPLSLEEQTRTALVEMGYSADDVAMAMETTGSHDLQRNRKVLEQFFDGGGTSAGAAAAAGSGGSKRLSRGGGGGGGGGAKAGKNEDDGYLTSMSNTTAALGTGAVDMVLLVRRDCSVGTGALASACAQTAAAMIGEASANGSATAATWRRREAALQAFGVEDSWKLADFLEKAKKLRLPTLGSRLCGPDGKSVLAVVGPGPAAQISQLVTGFKLEPL